MLKNAGSIVPAWHSQRQQGGAHARRRSASRWSVQLHSAGAARVPADHPLRPIRRWSTWCCGSCRPSSPGRMRRRAGRRFRFGAVVGTRPGLPGARARGVANAASVMCCERGERRWSITWSLWQRKRNEAPAYLGNPGQSSKSSLPEMAKALGLTIPPSLLVRADWVIE